MNAAAATAIDVSALLTGRVADRAALTYALSLALLLAARVWPLALIVPWLGLPRAPLALSLAITLVLVVCLYSPAAAGAGTLPSAAPALLVLALRELLIGIVYALSLGLPLFALQWSGALMGRGLGTSGGDLAIATLWRAFAVASFFALGGHRVALRALADALGSEPIGVLHAPADPLALALGSAHLVGEGFALAWLIALPVLAALLLAELGLQLSARGSGALALPGVLAPLRPLLWLLVSWASVAFVVNALPSIFDRGLRAARALWEAL